MSAVRVAQSARAIVILAKKQSGIGAVGSVVIKQLVDRVQQTLRLVPCNDALAAQVGLQIRHQESAGNSLPGDVTQHQTESFLAQIEKVVVIAPDLARLNTSAGILEGFQHRKRLGKEPGLHL